MKRNEKVEDATIAFGSKEADRIFLSILNDYPKMEEDDCRRETILFGLFTNAIQWLHINGWSEKSLVNEVFDHCEIAKDIIDEDDIE